MTSQTQTRLALELTPSSPFPTVEKLETAMKTQRCPPRLPALEGEHNPHPTTLLS